MTNLKNATNIYVGSSNVSRVMLGSEQIWPGAPTEPTGGIRQQTTGTWISSGDMEVTLPNNPLGTSLIVLIIAGNTVVPTPAGWTLRESQVNQMGHYLYTRPAGGASSWTITPNPSAPAACTWYVAEIINGEYDTGVSAHTTASGFDYNTPTVTPTAGRRLILASLGSVRDGGAETTVTDWSNGFTEVADVHVAHHDGPMQGVATLDVDSDGSTGYSTTGIYSALAHGRSAIIASFVTPPSGPDAEPLTVVSNIPAAGETNVGSTSNIFVKVSESLDPATVTPSSISLTDSSDTPVPITVSYDDPTREITIQPDVALANSTLYTVTLTTAIQGVNGSVLDGDHTWSFSTEPALGGISPLIQGHGGPIAIITSTANPFSTYYSEIMRAEGLNSFTVIDVGTADLATLEDYDVAILGDIDLTEDQVATFTTWVNDGGNLVAMHPDKKLSSLLGITDQTSTIDDAYLLVDTSKSPGAGIVDETIQFHGSADRYTAGPETTVVATLYSDAATATTNPAVTLRSVGSNGGHAIAFTYDLARSVVYTHQGNPDWSADDRDGNGVIRPNDLFFGAKSGDNQSDYIDLDKVAIPQADEQQRLLVNIINQVNMSRQPLPKFSYFPYNDKVVMVMSSDDHANGRNTVSALNHQIAESPPMCSVDDWECIRSTSLIYTNTNLTHEEALNYHSQGFDFGVHMNTGCMNWTESTLTSFLDGDLAGFRAKYPGLPHQTSNRIHCIAWSDYITAVKVEHSRGMRMDLNYYYWPGEWVQNRPGYMTGSGMSMRFADLDGTLLDVYQLPTHLVNESGQTFPENINLMLDRAQGPEGYYAVIGTHYDYSDSFDRQLVASCKSRGVRMVSAQQLLDWNDGRNASYFTNSSWSGSTFTFTATVDGKLRSMGRVLLPMNSKNGTITDISRDGVTIPYVTETMKGITYAVFVAATGTYSVTYGEDTTPPEVVAISPESNATDVNTNLENIVISMSKPLDPTTVSGVSAQLLNGAALIESTVSYNATTSQIIIKPTDILDINTSYTVSLTTDIKDAGGNSLATAYTSTFTTGDFSISFWAPNPQPVQHLDDDVSAELGLRFSSSQNGKITGIYFYKTMYDTENTHTVTLWQDATSAVLGTAVTTSETSVGWQYAEFETPIPIVAGNNYTASYRSPTGTYCYTPNFLQNTTTQGPLTIPPGGGVYTYGSGLPTNSFNWTNYWVDISFRPEV